MDRNPQPTDVQAAVLRELRAPDPDPLTDREREVIGLVAAGLKNGELARRLFVSENAVKKHVSLRRAPSLSPLRPRRQCFIGFGRT